MVTKTKKEKTLMSELLEENPELVYLTDIGVLLDDYIKAAAMLSDPSCSTKSWALCLVHTMSKRYDESSKYLQ